MSFREKRASKRLLLAEPLEGQFASSSVRILELGRIGALVDHETPFAVGTTGTLWFESGGEVVEIESEVVRSSMAGFPTHADLANYQSGLRFERALGESESTLRRVIGDRAKEMLMAQAANAMGVRLPNLHGEAQGLDADELARRTRESGYLCFSLELGVWERTLTTVPEQPYEGFTVGAFEDPDELENLCRVYEQSDPEGRRVIRLLAELSLTEGRKETPR